MTALKGFRQLSGFRQTVVRQSSASRQAAVSHQAVYIKTVYSRFEGFRQLVVSKAVVRQSSSPVQVVIRQW